MKKLYILILLWAIRTSLFAQANDSSFCIKKLIITMNVGPSMAGSGSDKEIIYSLDQEGRLSCNKILKSGKTYRSGKRGKINYDKMYPYHDSIGYHRVLNGDSLTHWLIKSTASTFSVADYNITDDELKKYSLSSQPEDTAYIMQIKKDLVIDFSRLISIPNMISRECDDCSSIGYGIQIIRCNHKSQYLGFGTSYASVGWQWETSLETGKMENAKVERFKTWFVMYDLFNWVAPSEMGSRYFFNKTNLIDSIVWYLKHIEA